MKGDIGAHEAFTVGNPDTYEPLLDRDDCLKAVGGVVFPTEAEARAILEGGRLPAAWFVERADKRPPPGTVYRVELPGAFAHCTRRSGELWRLTEPAKVQRLHRTTDNDALARTDDPDTSHDAARNLGPKLQKLERDVLDTITGMGGATTKEIAGLLGVARDSISPRIKPMRERGLVRDSRLKRDRSIVWEVGADTLPRQPCGQITEPV